MFREHRQKISSPFADFGCEGGGEQEGGVPVFSESIKGGRFLKKNFFSDNNKWSSKNLWRMVSADVWANKNFL